MNYDEIKTAIITIKFTPVWMKYDQLRLTNRTLKCLHQLSEHLNFGSMEENNVITRSSLRYYFHVITYQKEINSEKINKLNVSTGDSAQKDISKDLLKICFPRIISSLL